ncbi:unnamed protein product, partial [Urochloa humidicola]
VCAVCTTILAIDFRLTKPCAVYLRIVVQLKKKSLSFRDDIFEVIFTNNVRNLPILCLPTPI